MRVLLVEKSIHSATTLTAYLTSEAVQVEVTDTGEDALSLLRYEEFDIVLLNLALPDMTGTSFIVRMRQARHDTPVLALAPSLSGTARVAVLGAGADDVVEHATDREELLARMRAIVRRSRGYSDAMLRVGNVALNCDRHQVTVDGIDVTLTGKEFAVLQLLMLRKNTVMTKEVILSQIYGGLDEPEPKIIDVFVCKIRKKLERAGAADVIGTVWGRGYTIRDTGRNSFVPVAPSIPTPAVRLPSGLVAA